MARKTSYERMIDALKDAGIEWDEWPALIGVSLGSVPRKYGRELAPEVWNRLRLDRRGRSYSNFIGWTYWEFREGTTVVFRGADSLWRVGEFLDGNLVQAGAFSLKNGATTDDAFEAVRRRRDASSRRLDLRGVALKDLLASINNSRPEVRLEMERARLQREVEFAQGQLDDYDDISRAMVDDAHHKQRSIADRLIAVGLTRHHAALALAELQDDLQANPSKVVDERWPGRAIRIQRLAERQAELKALGS